MKNMSVNKNWAYLVLAGLLISTLGSAVYAEDQDGNKMKERHEKRQEKRQEIKENKGERHEAMKERHEKRQEKRDARK